MTTTTSPEQRRQLRHVLEQVWAELPPAGTGDLVTGVLALPLPAGPALLGRDGSSLPHLLVPVDAPPRLDIRLAGVSATVRTLLLDDRPQLFTDIACRRDGLVRVFLSLAVDVCAALAADPTDPGTTTARVVDDWRALFAPGGSKWTRARCAGLFGELTVLLRLLERDPAATTAWSGPTGAAHDFRSGARAIEVKTSSGAEGRLVTIHGWDQLEPPAGGVLHLAWLRVGEATGRTGRTVRDLLLEVRSTATEPSMVDALTVLLDLPAPPDPEVDRRRLSVDEERWYAVGDSFPRITPVSFATGAVPAGVVDLTYRVDLDTVPSPAVDPMTVLEPFGAGR